MKGEGGDMGEFGVEVHSSVNEERTTIVPARVPAVNFYGALEAGTPVASGPSLRSVLRLVQGETPLPTRMVGVGSQPAEFDSSSIQTVSDAIKRVNTHAYLGNAFAPISATVCCFLEYHAITVHHPV
jgi:hypothetical protein